MQFCSLSILKICQFKNGYLVGGKSINLGEKNGEQECAALVKSKHPDAYSATHNEYSTCYAVYGRTVNSNAKWRYCVLLPGNIISHI